MEEKVIEIDDEKEYDLDGTAMTGIENSNKSKYVSSYGFGVDHRYV